MEAATYDNRSNVTSRRLRDGTSIAYTIDAMNRVSFKNLPGSELDVTYTYDNLSRLTSASQTGNSLSFTYDALSRNLTQVGPQGTVSSQWDLAGRRTKLTYPGAGLHVDYDYLVTGEMTKIRENGATTGVGVLATFDYDNLGRRTLLTFGNGASQSYDFDPVSRLELLTNNLTGTTNDLSATFANNPASQFASTVQTGDAYAWTGHFNTNVTGTANGLNQLTSVGPKNLTYDTRGNVTAFGTKSFTYSSENLLLTGPGSTTLSYDPAMRLYQSVSGATTQRFAYDGLDRIAEYNGSNTLQRRYVHGPNMDEPLVWYEGTGTTDRRFLGSDERGSIISVSNSSGTVIQLNKYDEYGNPQSTNLGAFGYTGQTWLPTMGNWYYKARVYEPELGRFLQSDPFGYAGGINLYAYLGNDPINFVDPLGLGPCVEINGVIVCRGARPPGIGSRENEQILLDARLREQQAAVEMADAGQDICEISVNGKPSPKEAARTTQRDMAVRSVGGGLLFGGIIGMMGGYGSVALQRAFELKPGGAWDPQNSAAGNRIYGAVTAALGVPREVALRASGFVEEHGKESNSPYNPANGRWSDRRGNFGNRPQTIQAIDEGRQCVLGKGL